MNELNYIGADLIPEILGQSVKIRFTQSCNFKENL